jgi:hypothetical protein
MTEMDPVTMVIANLLFAVQVAPIVVVLVTIIRSFVLLRGRKREFEDWTRNPLMTGLSIVFLPGTLIYTAIRYLITSILRVDVQQVGGSSTYGELNLFLVVGRVPRVGVVLVALFSTIVLTIFVALIVVTIPFLLLLDFSLNLICWYIAVAVLFNASFRSGDAELVTKALRERPRSGAIELVAFVAVLVFIYSHFVGVTT